MDAAAVKAHRKWEALKRVTVERGATKHEAATASRLAVALAAKYGFGVDRREGKWREDFDTRFHRAEHRAAKRWAWEYRRCGKARCGCMRGGGPHGPYKYSKKRKGKKVVSIYVGK